MSDDETSTTWSRTTATAVLDHVVRALVDDPDSVSIEHVEGRRGITLEVRVAPGDMGRVIGKRGRTAQSIRTVVRAAAAVTASRSTSTSWISRACCSRSVVSCKAHGLRGEVIVTLVTDRRSAWRRAPCWRPTAVTWKSCGRIRTRAQLWVAFEGVDGRAAAEAMAGRVLRAEPVGRPEALWVHEIIGPRCASATGPSGAG